MSTYAHLVLLDPQLSQNIVREDWSVNLKSPILASNPQVVNLADAQIFGRQAVDVNTDANLPHWNIRIGNVVA